MNVYNVLGEVVATLMKGEQDAGYRSVVYFYWLHTVSVADPTRSFT
ncbi:MAG: hypothetical protein HY707_06740 [Ignavibacteriae bacterium]|nr:hypothetical protein [Ignavibacteriota bacterium]